MQIIQIISVFLQQNYNYNSTKVIKSNGKRKEFQGFV